jgi:hypothetical protein
VAQAASDNPDIRYHDRRDAKYNQLFHGHFSRGNEIGTLRVRLHIPMDAAWTRMAPAIAIAAGDCFSFAQGHFGWGNVLQQQSGPRGFII